MDKKTFRALQYVIRLAREANPHDTPREIAQVEAWMEEVAKEIDD